MIPKWIKKIIIISAWPLIKNRIIDLIKNEEYEKTLVEKINSKIDIPNLSEESEKKLISQVYDAAQETTTEFINKIDVNKIVEKI